MDSFSPYVHDQDIFMSMEEGLHLEEAAVIKRAREVAKGRITIGVNSLDNTILQDDEGRFVFDKINDAMVDEADSYHMSNYNIFQELHRRYLEFAGLEDDKNEKTYAKNVADAFTAIKRKYIRYKESSEATHN